MNEIKLNATFIPAVVDYDLSQLRSYCSLVCEKYTGLIVGKDEIEEVKKIKAKLNKGVKAIHAERIALKKELLKPYTNLENDIKDIEKTIQGVSDEINEQLVRYDDEERKAKYEKIVEYYNTFDKINNLDFENGVFNPKWLNKSMTFSKVETEIKERLKEIRSDLELISKMDNYSDIYNEYIKNGCNLKQALSVEPTTKHTMEPTVESTKVIPVFESPEEQTYEASFKVYGKLTQLQGLKKYLLDNKIKFEVK